MGDRIRIGLQRLRKCPRCQALLVALALTLALGGLGSTRMWQDIELKGFDLLTSVTATGQSQLPIVLVGIDDASLAEMGQRWPWPRALHAQMVESLSAAGAAVIAFDVLFEFATDESNDQALAQSIQNAGNVVLASGMVLQQTSHGTVWMRKDPLPLLSQAGAKAGLVNILYDRDQTLRRVPDNDDAFWRQIVRQLSARIPDIRMPKPPPEGALIRYTGPPGTYPRVSFYQALDPAKYLPGGDLADALVIIGRDTRSAADIGAAQTDTFATPFTLTGHPHMAGMEIHANVLENMLGGGAIQQVATGWTLALTAIVLLGMAGLQREFRPLRAALVAALLAILVCAAAWVLFSRSSWWLPVGSTLAAIASMLVIQTVTAYLAEREQRLSIRRMFSRYVPDAVVNTIAAHPEKLTLGGENRQLTLLFTDLAGFTGLSESMDPKGAAEVLNRYLTAMNQVVFDHGGTIDKFIGDSVMAFWNAPLPDARHALHAVRAASDMQAAMAPLNDKLRQDGLPALHMRIGVHTGVALVGNMGSAIGRLSYTAIGDAVNLASRLEGANKAYGTAILVSDDTARQIQAQVPLRRVDLVRVKGRHQAIEVWTPCEDASLVQATEDAITAFRQADGALCARHLDAIDRRWPGDPIAATYRARLEALAQSAPAPDWDGSWALDTK